jgi:hypothetical protein
MPCGFALMRAACLLRIDVEQLLALHCCQKFMRVNAEERSCTQLSTSDTKGGNLGTMPPFPGAPGFPPRAAGEWPSPGFHTSLPLTAALPGPGGGVLPHPPLVGALVPQLLLAPGRPPASLVTGPAINMPGHQAAMCLGILVPVPILVHDTAHASSPGSTATSQALPEPPPPGFSVVGSANMHQRAGLGLQAGAALPPPPLAASLPLIPGGSATAAPAAKAWLPAPSGFATAAAVSPLAKPLPPRLVKPPPPPLVKPPLPLEESRWPRASGGRQRGTGTGTWLAGPGADRSQWFLEASSIRGAAAAWLWRPCFWADQRPHRPAGAQTPPRPVACIIYQCLRDAKDG